MEILSTKTTLVSFPFGEGRDGVKNAITLLKLAAVTFFCYRISCKELKGLYLEGIL
jgi:hypothetical protein